MSWADNQELCPRGGCLEDGGGQGQPSMLDLSQAGLGRVVRLAPTTLVIAGSGAATSASDRRSASTPKKHTIKTAAHHPRPVGAATPPASWEMAKKDSRNAASSAVTAGTQRYHWFAPRAQIIATGTILVEVVRPTWASAAVYRS